MYPASAAPAGANSTIDLRSDTVTRPDAAMRAVMAAAEVGDDVFGDDPNVLALEAEAAELTGKEAGLYLSSGTQSNLSALLSHCQRGEEILVGASYHVRCYEAGGASVLGGIVLTSLPVGADASVDPADVTARIKPDDPHFPITRLLSLENTVSGKVIPIPRLSAAAEAARAGGLSVHLDGARFFNAVAALGCAPHELAAVADTVSLCLSKGLAAPVGSVLVGPRDVIARARRWRKMLGGGMRQAGVLAAAGRHALAHNRARLPEDHARAERLATLLRGLDASAPGKPVVQDTNMVFFSPRPEDIDRLADGLTRHGITVLPGGTMRLVLHKDIDDADMDRLEAALTAIYDTARV